MFRFFWTFKRLSSNFGSFYKKSSRFVWTDIVVMVLVFALIRRRPQQHQPATSNSDSAGRIELHATLRTSNVHLHYIYLLFVVVVGGVATSFMLFTTRSLACVAWYLLLLPGPPDALSTNRKKAKHENHIEHGIRRKKAPRVRWPWELMRVLYNNHSLLSLSLPLALPVSRFSVWMNSAQNTHVPLTLVLCACRAGL